MTDHPTTQIPVREQAEVPPEPPPASTLQYQNRMRLLQRVRSFWITGVLEQSLHGVALLALGFQEQPDAIANPWRLIIQESEHTSTSLPAGTRITEIYDEAHGELLILGEPGAGKTTLLLELARDLLGRAEQEQTHPIPVVFNLSSWMRKRQSLAAWLIEELETKYRVPRRVGSDWINTNQILLLLDGLDEVDATSRPACIQAINGYHQAHSLVPLVVCCRVNDLLPQANRLALDRAVTIQPLTTEQINEYLTRIGEQATSLHLALQNDPVLQELATTPLMLTILIQVYQDSSLEEIKGSVSAEVRKSQIFATYTQRMQRRRSVRSRYSPQQTVRWLKYLAQQMQQQNQTVFYIERMQPTWLLKKGPRRLYYGLIAGTICGLFVGLETLGTVLSFPLTVLITALIVGLLFGWLSEPGAERQNTKPITQTWMRIRQSLATALENRRKIGGVAGSFIGASSLLYLYLGDFDHWSFGSRIAGALAGGLPSGMCMGVCIGLAIRLERRIEPMEGSNWSWTAIRRDSVRWLLIGIGLIVGLIFALPFMISSHDVWLGYFLSFGLSTVFQLVLVIMLVSGVTRGLSKRTLDAQHIVTPNQGIWRSARYGVIMGIMAAGIVAVFVGASDFIAYSWLPLHMGFSIKKPLGIDREAVSLMSHLLGVSPTTSQEFWALHALFWALTDAAIPALAVGLCCGGAAYVQHFVLRFLLWCTRCTPFKYPRFLDYAAERIFLRKVGGGYIFIHRLLLEYFADVDTGETVDLVHVAHSLPPALAVQQEPLQADLGERQVTLADEDQYMINELKDQFLLNVNHELRTPLAVLGGSLELLEAYHEHLRHPQMGEVLALARENHEELVSLMNRVLEATRVMSEIPLAQSKEVCVHQILKEELATLSPQDVQAYTIRLDVPESVRVWADPQLLHQVLQNLLSNIFRYVPARTEICIEAVQSASSSPVCLSVQDAGPGIPAEELPHLFEKFVRLKRDLAGPRRGTGLGLYICKQLVEAMGGRIWVESSGCLGEGSRFCFTLPPFSPPS